MRRPSVHDDLRVRRPGRFSLSLAPEVESVLWGAWPFREAPGLSMVPISVDYEQVLEAGAVTAELEGRPKRPEGLHSLVAAASLLWRRDDHGDVNVQIGEPLDLSAFLAAHGDERPDQESERKAAITALTPTALLAAALADAPAGEALPWDALTARAGELAVAARGILLRYYANLAEGALG